jgi:hypothetical protein
MTLAILTILLMAAALYVVAASMPRALGYAIAIVFATVIGLTTYNVMPALSYGFYELPVILLFIGAVGGVCRLVSQQASDDETRVGGSLPWKVASLGAVAWILALFVASLGMLRSDTYRGIIEVTEKPLDASVEIIDQTHARLVDQSLAHRRALELLGVEKGLGSSYSVGPPTVQLVAGKQVWVAPLEPARLWVWLTNEATPGYVVVSATNYSDARIVLDHPMRFTKNAWFGNNVERRAWNYAPTVGQAEPSFEIDDAGKPFWIVPTYANTAGGAGAKVTGTVIVDATTGAMETFGVDKQPAWVDRIQPEWISAEQLELWGDYVHGYWNFGLNDVVHPTSGLSLVNLRDGRSAWFTGIVNARSQSQNSAATNGFALVDTRTGKATFYQQQGVSEEAAQMAMQGAVQEKRYHATHPIAYLVHGALTYVGTLKDDAGNPRLIAMVSALDRSIVATGESLEDVTRVYATRLRTASVRVTSLGAEAKPEDVSGLLVRSGAYVLDGRSYQIVRLDVEGQTRDFSVDLGVAAYREIVLAIPGDRVELKVLAGAEGLDEIRGLNVVPKP